MCKKTMKNLSVTTNMFIHLFVHFLIISFLCSLRISVEHGFLPSTEQEVNVSTRSWSARNFKLCLNCEAQVMSEENSL